MLRPAGKAPVSTRKTQGKTLKAKRVRLRLNMIQEAEKQAAGTPALSPEEHRARMREYVQRWARVGPLLEAQREEDVRRSDTLSNIAAFNRLYEMALAASPPVPDSGLVEQQRLFSKLRQ